MKKQQKDIQVSWYWVDLETQPIYYIQCDHGEGLVNLEENFYREAVSGHSHPRRKALIDHFGDEESETDTF